MNHWVCLLFFTVQALMAAVPEISVGVFERQEKLKISAEFGFTIYDSDQKKVELFKRWNKTPLDIVSTAVGFNFEKVKNQRSIYIVPFRKKPLSINSMAFRGEFEIREDRFGKMTVVNFLDLESYLYGVIKSEMLLNSPLEALKAQAVVARTYAIRNRDKFTKELGFGLTRDVRSQVYNGVNDEHPLALRVVDETRGRIVTHNGEPIAAYYHSACGGATQDSSHWGSQVAYLRAVACKYCDSYKELGWERELSLAEVTNRLREKGQRIPNLSDIRFERDSFGRVISVEIVHAKGSQKMNANHFRTLLGASDLRSTMFTASNESIQDQDPAEKAIDQILQSFMARMSPEKVITLKGTGFGHGVGLCQWGAKGLAAIGYNYEKILKYYYTGVAVTRLYE